MIRTSTLLAALAALFAAIPAVAAPAAGRQDPVVISGAELTQLDGVSGERLVGYRLRFKPNGRPAWKRIPVQLDQRKLVDFGSEPAGNQAPGTEGTVYGTAPIGQAVLQYADPQTFVGGDPVPGLDDDDEVALLAADAGERAKRATSWPRRVRGSSATRLALADPLGDPRRFVYLFASRGKPRGQVRDDVAYSFSLAAGDYRLTYKRADGPNPESSRIVTDAYAIGFSDRWFFDTLELGGVDILDGFKFTFGPQSCGRSEATFNDAEGAFVANLDGPVRAIRSYVGANSGPLTQRTHIFYADRHELITDLRVHPVPGPLTYHDLSPAGIGMRYFNGAGGDEVTVDGNPDTVAATPAPWHMWTGAQGSLFAADRIESSFAEELMAGASTWYLDDSTPSPNVQCWGDAQALGQAGLRSTTSMPNTDPRSTPVDYLRSTTTEILSGPGSDRADAKRWSAELDAPVVARAKAIRR